MKTSALFCYLLPALWLIQINPVNAQTALDDLAPEAWFDFWLGNWDLTWEDADGTLAKGSNRIERILDGNVIKESFKALTGAYEGFEGESYSVYNTRTGGRIICGPSVVMRKSDFELREKLSHLTDRQ